MRHLRQSAPPPVLWQAPLRLALVSLALAVGIGCCLACLWAGEALTGAVERLLAAGHAHDLVVEAPLGLAESDLARMRAVEGVTGVEAAFEETCTVSFADATRHSLVVRSLTDDVDTLTLTKGELPSRAGEIALLTASASRLGLKPGDVLEIASDETSGPLRCTQFTVCGLVSTPAFLSGDEWCLGVSDGPCGIAEGMAFTPRSTFPAARYLTGFDVAYLSCEAEDVETVRNGTEGLGRRLAPLRVARLRTLADVGAEAGQSTRSALERVSTEIDGSRKEFEARSGELEAGQAELDSSAEALDEEQQEGERELGEAHEELARDREAYEERRRELEAARTELDGVTEVASAGTEGLDDALRVFEQLRESFRSLSGELDSIESGVGEWAEADPRGSVRSKRLEMAQDSYAGFLTSYRQCAEALAGTGEALSASAEDLGIDLLAPELPGLADRLDPEDPTSTVEAARAGLAVLDGFIASVDDASRVVSGVTIRLVDPTSSLEEALADLEAREGELEEERRALDERQSDLERRVEEFETRINEGRRELADSAERIERDRAALEQDEARLKRDQRALEGERNAASDDARRLAEVAGRAASAASSGWRVWTGAERGGLIEAAFATQFLQRACALLAALVACVGFVCLHAQLRQVALASARDERHLVPRGRRRLVLVGLGCVSALVGVLLAVPVALGVERALCAVLLREFSLPEPDVVVTPLSLAGAASMTLVLSVVASWSATRTRLTDASSGNKGGSRDLGRGFWAGLAPYTRATLANCLDNASGMVCMVVGCALCAFVTTTSLALDASGARTRDYHFGHVSEADVAVVLESVSQQTADVVCSRLEGKGYDCTDAYATRHQLCWPNGARSTASVLVPTSDDFERLYHPQSLAGGAIELVGGAWMGEGAARAYGQGRLLVMGSDGRTLDVGTLGVCDVFLLRPRLVIAGPDYGAGFGKSVPNVVLVASEGSVDEVRRLLADVEGVWSVEDLKSRAADECRGLEQGFAGIAVAGLVSSAVLVAMGLFAFDASYVRKRHAELLSLGLEGFGSYDARSYLLRDGIVFIVVGVALGGACAVAVTPMLVCALEPQTASMVAQPSFVSVAAGVALTLVANLGALGVALARLRDLYL